MSYPYLPVNPCCTDVVLNTPCGCSSTITNGGCNDNPCSTNLTASSTIVYDGPALSCTTAEPCDTLNVILQKIDEIICNLLTQISALTIQVDNITTQIITINGDIININNQLDVCCNATTTSTTTAAPILCESFSLDNTGEDPVAIIITDCITGDQEAIVLLPGETNICVETDSPLTVPGTVIVTPNGPCGTTSTTTTIVPTTTTTTTASPCECLTFNNEGLVSHIISYRDCDGSYSRPIEILSGQIINYCGSEGEASSPNVTITIGANCIDGECPVTTTTTTTAFPCTQYSWNLTGIDPETVVTIEWDECGGEGDTHVIITQPAGDFDNPYLFCSETFPTIALGTLTSEGDCGGTTTTTSSSSTTTSTSTTIAPTTTSTTTPYSGCRPQGLITVEYFNSYDDGSGVVNYTDSLTDACNACAYINGLPLAPAETSLFGQSIIFAIGQLVYAGTGTSCDLLADGFYITDHETCEITEIVDGYIVSITNCGDITTTTTSSTSSSSTTTTTTGVPTTTTTTTAYPYSCTCMNVTIAQADLDDATGNTIPGITNGAVYLRTTKNSGCDDSEIDRTYTSVAESESWCIKVSSIPTIQMFYYKNNNPVYLPAIDSTYTILYSNCSVNGDCAITTTTTTTVAPI
jgi:hypothetical protein